MRPCTRRIASAEDIIKATSLDDVLVEHAPWCRTAPTALLIHIKPLDARPRLRKNRYEVAPTRRRGQQASGSSRSRREWGA